jgi:hypothetical protein
MSSSFTFRVASADTASNLIGMTILISAAVPSDPSNACYLTYDHAKRTIDLFSDNLSGVKSKSISSPAMLKNSQCAVGEGTVTSSGLNSIALTITLSFKNSFSGLKTVYLQTNRAAFNSAWLSVGNWTVNSGGSPTVSVVVSPGSASLVSNGTQQFVATVNGSTNTM